MSNGSSDEEVAIDDDCGNGDYCVDTEGFGLVGVDVKSGADDGVPVVQVVNLDVQKSAGKSDGPEYRPHRKLSRGEDQYSLQRKMKHVKEKKIYLFA